jgi:hypothetical protein
MQLKACLGFALLALGACETIPSLVRVEVDGSTVEFKKKQEPPAAPAPTSAPAATPAPAPAPAPASPETPAAPDARQG